MRLKGTETLPSLRSRDFIKLSALRLILSSNIFNYRNSSKLVFPNSQIYVVGHHHIATLPYSTLLLSPCRTLTPSLKINYNALGMNSYSILNTPFMASYGCPPQQHYNALGLNNYSTPPPVHYHNAQPLQQPQPSYQPAKQRNGKAEEVQNESLVFEGWEDSSGTTGSNIGTAATGVDGGASVDWGCCECCNCCCCCCCS